MGSSLINPEIFRAYDIRGIVDITLTAQSLFLLGQAIGTKTLLYNLDKKDRKVIVARDGRLSGNKLIKLLKQGIRSTGCDVLDLGLVPTPLLYFATHHLGIGSAAMLTASHNPSAYNGLKIMLQGQALYGEQIQELKDLIIEQKLVTVNSANWGREYEIDLQTEYINCITKDINLAKNKPIKVVVDCGNGAAGVIAEKLLHSLRVEVVPLYCEVDGNFPNHHPDPMVPENLTDLINTVIAVNADLGLALDGDGDRLGVVDHKGNIIWPDQYFMLFIQEVLAKRLQAKDNAEFIDSPVIIYDIKSTNQLENFIHQAGGTPLMWKTGHSVIKAKIREMGALLAGEMSGHIFFKDRWFGFDDGLYTAARLLEIISITNQSLLELCSSLPKNLATPELKIASTESSKHGIVQRLIAEVKPIGAKVTTIDGLRLDFSKSWGLFRASNTTPNLIARFEGVDLINLNKVKSFFKKHLLKIDPSLNLPF